MKRFAIFVLIVLMSVGFFMAVDSLMGLGLSQSVRNIRHTFTFMGWSEYLTSLALLSVFLVTEIVSSRKKARAKRGG